MPIDSDLQRLSTSPLIELFALTDYNPSNPNEIFRFTPWRECTWLGLEWQHLDAKTSGFNSDSRSLPRPKIKISNEVANTISPLVAVYSDLLGATLFRYRTPEAIIQAGGSEMVLVEEWFIQQKTAHDKNVIEWELSAVNLENVQVPKRLFQNTYCGHQYRGDGCGYAGGPVATIDDVATSDFLEDDCGRKIGSCRLRFGNNSQLPIDIFPGLT
jgi:lambda family phage minor tail protein L